MIITFRKQKTLDVYSDVAANLMSLADTDLSLPTVDFWKKWKRKYYQFSIPPENA